MGEVISILDRIKKNNDRVLQRLNDKDDDLCNSTLEQSWFPPKGIFDRKLGRMLPAREEEKQ